MPTHPFRARHRIAHARDYQAVFKERVIKSRGPLTVFIRPTDHPEHRLGLSIGKRVGGAVERVRVKRAIRESFRLDRPVYPNLPNSRHIDLVVSARRHKPLTLNEYRTLLKDAINAARREHDRRSRQTGRST